MYIEKPWKEFNISLPKLREALEALTPKAAGIAIGHGGALWLCFSEQPSEAEMAQIDALYEAIDEEHEIATSYQTQAQIEAAAQAKKEAREAAIQALKLSALSKSWDDMSATEKKAAMNLELSDEELGLE